MLKVTGLCAGYGLIPVLDRVDLSLDAGTAVGVLGPNGVGKTALLRTLMGFLTVTAGRVEFNGRDVTADPPHFRARAGFGYVPQEQGVFLRMTVREHLRYAMTAAGGRANTLSGTLDRFPVLAPLLNRTGGTLSGGERKLLALACCLCTRPRLLLLDEPVEGIQPGFVDRILELLIALKRQDHLSILIAEQKQEIIEKLCDQTLILRKGSVVAAVESSAPPPDSTAKQPTLP